MESPACRLIRKATVAVVLAGAVAIALGACSLNVTHERDASILIPAGAIVAYGGGSSEGRENLDPEVSNEVVHFSIQKSITAELESRGYRLVAEPERADFLVRYFFAVRSSARPAVTPGSDRVAVQGPGWGWGWGGGSVTRITPLDFADTSIAVYLVERSTDRTAWRGLWRGDTGARAPTQEEIDLKISRIFRSAPAAR